MKNMRISRRNASIVVSVFVVGSAVAGCDNQSVSKGSTGKTPTASHAASVSVPLPPISSLDPAQWGGQILIDQGTVLEGLVGYNTKNELVPKIAQKWTSSDHGMVWTFYLRHDAKWSNGKPVTAQDFYYSWMRIASPQDTTGAMWASVIGSVRNAYQYHIGAVPASKVGLKVINPYELQITLAAPGDVLGELQLSGSMPLYAPAVNAHPTNWFLPQYFVGDGPYTVKSFVPNGQISLVRNPSYVGASGQLNVGNVQQINVLPTPTVPLEDYLAHKLDVAPITSPSDYQYVLTHPQLKAQLHKDPLALIQYMEWDKSTMPSPLDNVTVRQAISMAIDKGPLVNPVQNGMAGVTNNFAYPGWPTDSAEHGLPYNVTQAKALLAKAGYPDGKNMPTLYLYCQTPTNYAPSVNVAEAIAQELKQNLNINFKIVPLASTVYGDIAYGGLNKGIEPGYNLTGADANWDAFGNLPIGVNQMIGTPGAFGPVVYRDHISSYYFSKYDPDEVKMWGNPDDASMGTTWAQWLPLQKSALADIQYLSSWMAKQPAAYKALLTVPGTVSNLATWNGFVSQFKSAKTAADKHTAWVNAWKFVGDYSTGNGGASIGLQGQVYVDQNEPEDAYKLSMWNTEEADATSEPQAVQLTAQIANLMMSLGYCTPLYYGENFYLEAPGVEGVQTNPWGWENFYQLQYMTVN